MSVRWTKHRSRLPRWSWRHERLFHVLWAMCVYAGLWMHWTWFGDNGCETPLWITHDIMLPKSWVMISAGETKPRQIELSKTSVVGGMVFLGQHDDMQDGSEHGATIPVFFTHAVTKCWHTYTFLKRNGDNWATITHNKDARFIANSSRNIVIDQCEGIFQCVGVQLWAINNENCHWSRSATAKT